MKKALWLIVASGFMCGCSMINPYQSEFSCPDTFKGKCASVREVYMEDAAGGAKDNAEHAPVKSRCTSTYNGMEGGGMETTCSEPSPGETDKVAARTLAPATPLTGNIEEKNYNQYRSALYDKFNGLLKEPQTPIVAPPKVMRVLLLPYTGQENEFYMLRYVYFFVDKPRWILGDSVTADGEDE
ncbi:MAG TPA: type IV conjugative transfer system lipoprotein TraV [Geobacteraceae bacterium]